MKHFFTLLKYELYRWVVSPSTYAMALIFESLLVTIFLFLLHEYTVSEQTVPFVQMFFRCFWLPTCTTIPLLTMRTFSEEYKTGTYESLFSLPISAWQASCAKNFATYIVFIVLWATSLLMLFAVGKQQGTIWHEVSFMMPYNLSGGLTFIMLISMPLIAIGILCSALTENQIVSGMLTFFFLLIIFICGQLLVTNTKSSNANILQLSSEPLNLFWQLDHFCNGVIDIPTVIFYVSSCIAINAITAIVLRHHVK